MNILMMTNTYLPHVGGVAQSVARLAEECRESGHRTLIVAPEFGEKAEREADVTRVPAIQQFNGSDFSVRLPIPGLLAARLDEFGPEVVHTHHPFLLGDTALRVSSQRDLPLVFTHHTMYERYTHYVPGDSPMMQRFAVMMVTGYANLCDVVIAPSESIRDVLCERGVTVPIEPIPTGVDLEKFGSGDGAAARRRAGVPEDAFLIGHLGRLAPEKNIPLLAEAMADAARSTGAHALVVGDGPSRADFERLFGERGLSDRLHLTGKLSGQELTDAYHAMNVFAFASTSETQGMVLAEAMAAGVPVVALDAPGAREVVRDGMNGRLVEREHSGVLTKAISEIAALEREAYGALVQGALDAADDFSVQRCAARVMEVYERARAERGERRAPSETLWDIARRRFETEWRLWSGRFSAAAEAVEGRTERTASED